MKPKILQIITLAECGGAQTHLLELINGLKDKFDFVVLVAAQGFLTDRLDDLKIPYRIIFSLKREISPIDDLKAVVEFCQAIKSIKPNLVHCHSSKAGIVGRLASFILRVPAIYTAHGWGFHPKVRLTTRFIALVSEALCALISKRIICVSEFDRQMAISSKVFPVNKLKTIHNGIAELATGEQAKRLQSNKLKILMVGRFAEPKRQNLLIEAYASLPRSLQNQTHLLFAGEGPDLSSSIELVERLKLQKQIIFLGQLHPIDQLLHEVDLFVLLSDREGLPMSLIEALKFSLPVVASAVGGIPELIEHQVNGLLVNNNLKEVTSALSNLIEDSELRQQMGKASLQKFKERFTREKMLLSLQEIYLREISFEAQSTL